MRYQSLQHPSTAAMLKERSNRELRFVFTPFPFFVFDAALACEEGDLDKKTITTPDKERSDMCVFLFGFLLVMCIFFIPRTR